MKKILLFLVGILLSTSVMHAQDLITTKAGEEIKAKITEVGATEIKYKKWTNLEGPTYSLLKNEIFMIKYQNGEKEVFKETPSTNQNNQQNQYNNQGIQQTGILDFDSRSRSRLSLNGRGLSEYEAQEILGRTSYDNWAYGYAKRIWGKTLLWCGVGLTTLDGIILTATEGDVDEGGTIYIVGLGISGLASVITGWILWANGNKDMNYVIDSFNDKRGNKFTLSLNQNQYGVGLKLTF